MNSSKFFSLAVVAVFAISGCSSVLRASACDSAWGYLDEETIFAVISPNLRSDSTASDYRALAERIDKLAENLESISSNDQELEEILGDMSVSAYFIADFVALGPWDVDSMPLEKSRQYLYDVDKFTADGDRLYELCGPPDWAEG